MRSNVPLFELKPVFLIKLVLLRSIVLMLMIPPLILSSPTGEFTSSLFIFAFGLFFVALIGVIVLSKLTYRATKYVFFPNCIEYFEGFLNQNLKTLPVSKVIGVNLKRSVLQRMFNLGTIIIETPNTVASSYGQINGGIVMKDLEKSVEMYNKIKELYKV